MRLLLFMLFSGALFLLDYIGLTNLGWFYCCLPTFILIIFALVNGFVAVTSRTPGDGEPKVKFSDTLNLYKRYKNGKL